MAEINRMKQNLDILVVNSLDFRNDLVRNLLESNYENIRTASNHISAIEAVKKANPMIDLVLIEQNGIDPYKLTEKIRTFDNDALIMCLTLYPDLAKFVKAGGNAVMYLDVAKNKPDILDQKIQEMIRSNYHSDVFVNRSRI